ncbi:serine/threonine protein phosphatase [Clostridium sp. PL3]|uniref:Serine/threonine protein phosphatase n=1 Tax=Clostridium thailandense TaxID=2794346 RepID=A0A949WSM0_9CLOT|nr:serine/threonine protein phosphatase [Clostridium thailandense]MBV7275330.1 serine/threonine protein phosphatase [Clostridium thailandense]
MRKDNSEFKTSFTSEAGAFAINKDYFAFVELDDFACYVAADGIDSDEDIKSAELAVKSIFADFTEKPTMSRRRLKRYMINASKVLEQESRSVRLKASLIMIVTDYSKIVWVCTGNARLYHFRKGRFNFKSKDQSLAQMMAEAGKIDEYEIDQHEEKNNLVNYLGKSNNFTPFISKKYKLNDGDVMLLCTSGLWENVNINEMTAALKDAEEPEQFIDSLEELLLSKQKRLLSNYTAAAIFGNRIFKESNKDKKDYIKKIAAVMLPILMISAGIITYRIINLKKQATIRAQLIKSESNGDEFIKDGDFDKALKEYQDAEADLQKLKIKDKQKELDKKCKITQYIVDGDKNFKDKDYEKAEKNYEKAKKLADEEKDYDEKELNKKISQTNDFMDILAVEKQGDTQLENQDFAGAKETYTKAKGLADKFSFEDAKKDLKAKIQDADSKIADLDKKQKAVQGTDSEKQGDDSYAAKDYKKALEAYLTAQSTYQQLNNLQGVLSIETKIKDVQEKLNPPAALDANKSTPAPSEGTSTNTK